MFGEICFPFTFDTKIVSVDVQNPSKHILEIPFRTSYRNSRVGGNIWSLNDTKKCGVGVCVEPTHELFWPHFI